MATSLETVINICTRWQIEALTVLSLFLQITLIVFGSKRKVTVSKWVSGVVWCAYNSADWVATVALGTLARSLVENNNNNNNDPNRNRNLSHQLQAFWAPFLVLHLGGPDTITAYSLEDNELWLRHFLGLTFQVGVAIYVFFKSWGDSHNTISFIAIPVYVSGIIKYGERTWVLRKASGKGSRYFDHNSSSVLKEELESNQTQLCQAVYIFDRVLTTIFEGYYFREFEAIYCCRVIGGLKPPEAFKVVEIGLGFLYDVLFTKAAMVFTCYGIILRCITLLASVSALLTFSIITVQGNHGYRSSPVDISVTYLLLVGSVFLEVYALLVASSSDWTVFRNFHPWKFKGCSSNDKRWSRVIGQCNLIRFCLRKKHIKCYQRCWRAIQERFGVDVDILIENQCVDEELQDFIIRKLMKRAMSSEFYEIFDTFKLWKSSAIEKRRKILNYRGDHVLEENNCLLELKWCTIDAEFVNCIFIWHIATDLCYYVDSKRDGYNDVDGRSKISRCFSNYMLYLLLVCPDMVPKETARIEVECVRAKNIFMKFSSGLLVKNEEDACQELLKLIDGDELEDFGLLRAGRKLAHQLQNLKPQNQNNWGYKEKWEMMNEIWMELLTYAASHCGWKEHFEHMRINGGELLTHVCVLMANFGLSEQMLYSGIINVQ